MVNRDDYKLMLDKAVTELTEAQERRAELDVERDQLDARIAELKQGIIALGPLCGVAAKFEYADLLPEYNAVLPVGLKEAVLSVLGMVGGDYYITPVAIRDGLTSTGYENKSKNILPSIHNVLKRLEKANPPEVETIDLDGKTGYRLPKKEQKLVAPPPPPRQARRYVPVRSTTVPPINPPSVDMSTLKRGAETLYEAAKKAAEEAAKKK